MYGFVFQRSVEKYYIWSRTIKTVFQFWLQANQFESSCCDGNSPFSRVTEGLNARFWVLTMAAMKSTVFWDVMLYNLVEVYQISTFRK
jgi:hypothetical protein